MEVLHIELLGSPSIRLGERPLTGFTTTKAQALLFYLAVTQREHSRDALASLFWRDVPDRQAKKNLRNALPNLRALIGSHLTIKRHSVAFNRASSYRLDVEVFRSLLASHPTMVNMQALQDATALYRDDFLANFHVRNAPAFEEWTLMEREYLRALAIDALLALAQQCIKQFNYGLGLATTKRLLSLDPWRESAHQQHMLLLAYSGQRHAALAHYDTCRTLLAEELGVAPMKETSTLYEQIKADALVFPHTATPFSPLLGARGGPQVDWTEFPKRVPYYGRHAELTQLYQWLTEKDMSLVGIFGLGGQGKTALATHLTWKLAEDEYVEPSHKDVRDQEFDCIIWRSLANAPPFSATLQRWLTFLSDHHVTQVPHHVDEQLALLFDQLRQQRCLLILDSVECLLDDDAFQPDFKAYWQLIQQLNQRMHRSRLLLISRVRPREFDALCTNADRVQSMHLYGLTEDASDQLIQTQGICGSDEAIRALAVRYSGHPLALQLAAITVKEFFSGDLDAFLAGAPLIFDDLRTILDQQLATLPPLGRQIIKQLASRHKPIMLQTLQDNLSYSPLQHTLLEALRTLQNRSLLETSQHGLSIQNVVSDYIAIHGHNLESIYPDQPEKTLTA